jgi:hypothetical protein
MFACRSALAGILISTAAVAFSGAAQADVVNFSLDTGNAALSGFPTPFGSVSIDRTSTTTANVTFTSILNSGTQYAFGDGGSTDLNVNGSYNFTTPVYTALFPAGNPTFVANVPGQVDGFGTFNLSFNMFDGFGDAATAVTFTLTNTSGTPWASAAGVLTPNTDGHEVAAHIFACAAPCSTDAGTLATGFATGHVAPVPETSTWAMMILGFFGVGFMAYRRRSSGPTLRLV